MAIAKIGHPNFRHFVIEGGASPPLYPSLTQPPAPRPAAVTWLCRRGKCHPDPALGFPPVGGLTVLLYTTRYPTSVVTMISLIFVRWGPSPPPPLRCAGVGKPPHGLGVCIWMHLVNGTGNSPSPGQPPPGVVKQDQSSGGSVDTTKTCSDPQRVRMSSGERPIGAAKGKQPDTEALCQPPPPPPPPPLCGLRPISAVGG